MAKNTKKFENGEDVEADKLLAVHVSGLDDENLAAAEDAGVVHPAYVNYEEALDTYQQRNDVETLEARRARESGSKFEDASFRRQLATTDDEAQGGVVTSGQAASGTKPEKSDK